MARVFILPTFEPLCHPLRGFVHPQSGETYWWIVPKLNLEVFGGILADFAEHFRLGAQRRVVLALDQASFHTSEQLQV